jgi:hypothetical protein
MVCSRRWWASSAHADRRASSSWRRRSSLAGRLQMLDARTMEWNEIRIARLAGCPVCGTRD